MPPGWPYRDLGIKALAATDGGIIGRCVLDPCEAKRQIIFSVYSNHVQIRKSVAILNQFGATNPPFVLQVVLAVCCLASVSAAPGYLGGLAAPAALPLAAAPAISYGHSLAAPSIASYGLAHGPALAAPAYSHSLSLAPRISYAAPALAHAPLGLAHAPLGLAHAPLGLGLAHAPLAAPLGLGIKSYASPALGLGLGHGW